MASPATMASTPRRLPVRDPLPTVPAPLFTSAPPPYGEMTRPVNGPPRTDCAPPRRRTQLGLRTGPVCCPPLQQRCWRGDRIVPATLSARTLSPPPRPWLERAARRAALAGDRRHAGLDRHLRIHRTRGAARGAREGRRRGARPAHLVRVRRPHRRRRAARRRRAQVPRRRAAAPVRRRAARGAGGRRRLRHAVDDRGDRAGRELGRPGRAADVGRRPFWSMPFLPHRRAAPRAARGRARRRRACSSSRISRRPARSSSAPRRLPSSTRPGSPRSATERG